MSRLLTSLLLLLAAAPICPASPAPAETPSAYLTELLRDPSAAEWRALARFDGTLTRREFEARLDQVFDPWRGLRPWLRVNNAVAAVYASPQQTGAPLAVIRFAPVSASSPAPVTFRPPAEFRRATAPVQGRPLAGLRVAIEPADIGGRWAKWEDRSVEFRGYGRINEGDLNVVVGRVLREKLEQLGASVFLVRDRTEPVLPLLPEMLVRAAESMLISRPELVPEVLGRHATEDPARLRIAAEFFLTKTAETKARVALVRRSFQPDITVVLQHNATPESAEGRLTRTNRNIFFVEGAYGPREFHEPEQRFRALTKLLENVTPVEAAVADAIARRFVSTTGFAPVLYGDSANTRLVLRNDPYVVARNLAFSREHDGPVVVTEPYFMNQPDTLQRLLAGDYDGERIVAGRARMSIYREYAGCVARGLTDVYGR